MQKFFLVFVFLFSGYALNAQYTETINSNRPGFSQGAFAVGKGVLEFEAGVHYGKDKHHLLNRKTDLLGANYQLRYGILWEELEINFIGDFLSAKQQITRGGIEQSYRFSNFKSNTLGLKYLVYDPYKQHYFDKPNLYSWRANHRFKWWKLIPAISIYAGANLNFGDLPEGYPFFGKTRKQVSPKVALITQNNWGSFVFVMNFIADRLTEVHKRYVGIFTLTHTFSRRFSLFVEYEALKNDFYSDDLFRFGGAFLINRNFQIDLSGLINFKDTPSRWRAGLGASYRLDLHSGNEKLNDPDKNDSPYHSSYEKFMDRRMHRRR